MRYKGQTTPRQIDRNYPHQVEIAIVLYIANCRLIVDSMSRITRPTADLHARFGIAALDASRQKRGNIGIYHFLRNLRFQRSPNLGSVPKT